MSADATPPDSRELLAHTGFVRRLARSLLRDEHLAEDVAQDALVAALRPGGPPPRSLGAWLAGTVRNIAALRLRSATRRVARETRHVVDTTVPPPDTIIGRLEVERLVVEAVRALDDPIRSTVFLRYFDELTPTEIARRTGVPIGTVKTRLRRGLAQLRERLDGAQPGGRASWSVALVPHAGRDAWFGQTVTGGVVMAAKSKAAVLGALFLGVFVGAVGNEMFDRSGAATELHASSVDVAEMPKSRTGVRPGRAGSSQPSDPAAVIPRTEATAPRSAPGRALAVVGEGRITGTVRDTDGKPVPGVRVLAMHAVEGFPLEARYPVTPTDVESRVDSAARTNRRLQGDGRPVETATGADGAFELTGLADARYHVSRTTRGTSCARRGASADGGSPPETVSSSSRRSSAMCAWTCAGPPASRSTRPWSRCGETAAESATWHGRRTNRRCP